MNEYAIHVGAHCAKGTPKELQRMIRNTLKVEDDPFTSVEAYVDGDSFREWGEDLNRVDNDHYYHVVVYYTAPDGKERIEGARLCHILFAAGLASHTANCASVNTPQKHFNYCISTKDDWDEQSDWGYLN